MNDNMLPPGCDFNKEPVQAHENMVNQIQEIIDDEEISCKIGGYEEALEKIGFSSLHECNEELKKMCKEVGGAEWYIDADDCYLLVIATGAEEWRLYELLERKGL